MPGYLVFGGLDAWMPGYWQDYSNPAGLEAWMPGCLETGWLASWLAG